MEQTPHGYPPTLRLASALAGGDSDVVCDAAWVVGSELVCGAASGRVWAGSGDTGCGGFLAARPSCMPVGGNVVSKPNTAAHRGQQGGGTFPSSSVKHW